MKALLKLENINKFFEEDGKRLHAVKDVDLEIRQGEFFVLLGPSGSGKSTVLRIMAGLIPVTSGCVTRSKKLRQAFIFQNFALFPWLSVYHNIEFGLKMDGMPENDRRRLVTLQIERMGLKGFENALPHELSGGMKQRVGIARALAIKPDIIFLDEPFSALDSFTAAKLRAELLSIWEEKKLTVVMVTHLIEEALQLGDRIAVLSPRPAVVESLMVNHLSRPRNTRSDEFFKLVDNIHKTITV
jgi:NitT/TauT family transport system ATP-binding protein